MTSLALALRTSSRFSIARTALRRISGPAGQKRDWDRFASLFHPGARLVPTVRRPDGTVVSRVITPQEYAERSGPMLERDGFFEKEIARTTERFGNVVHAFQNPMLVVIYLIGQLVLGLHLSHALSSSLQTLGLEHPMLDRLFRGAGPLIAVLVVVGNTAIVLAIAFGLVHA